MTKSETFIYRKLRAAGNSVSDSGRDARTVAAFRKAECRALGDEGAVRISAEPEEDNYIDVYGKPEGYTSIGGHVVSAEEEEKQLTESIENLGCWYVKTEYLCPCCEQWQYADGVGMNTGYEHPTSPYENCYVPQPMAAAVEALGTFCAPCSRHHKKAS
jgi:hypothetical protein